MLDFKLKQRSFYIKHERPYRQRHPSALDFPYFVCLHLNCNVISTGIWVLSFPVMVSVVAPQTALHSLHIWWHASAQFGTKALFWTHCCRLLPDPNCLLPSELLNRNDR